MKKHIAAKISAHGAKVRAKMGKLVENDQAFFEIWFRNGANTQKTAKELSVSRTALQAHVKKASWVDRAKQRRARMAEKADESIASMIVKDSLDMYKTMSLANGQAVRMLRDQRLTPSGLDKVTAGMDRVIKNKRLLAGETTENQGMTFRDVAEAAEKARKKGGA